MNKIYIGVICYLRKDFDWFIRKEVVNDSNRIIYVCITKVDDMRGRLFDSVFCMDGSSRNEDYHELRDIALTRVKD